MSVQSDAPVTIPLSDEERLTGDLTPRHLFDAVDALFKDGVVVLRNAIELDVIDRLNDKMKEDTEKILTGKVQGIYWNQGKEKGNVSQVPPIEKGWLFPQIYANKSAAKVLSSVLGPRPELRYIRSNTLIGNTTTRQDVHKDVPANHLSHPFAIAMNVCLIDAFPENGSTELWLGTSAIASPDDHIKPEAGYVRPDRLEERRKFRPPVQGKIERGSLILRDLRLWHAGMPNHTSDTRVMLAFVYFASWYANEMRQPVPRSLEPVFEALAKSNDTVIGVKFQDDDEVADYLTTDFVTDFDSPFQLQ